MESSGKLVISYWKIRGLLRHIEYVLEYVGAEYEVKHYEAGPAPDFCKKTWFDEKFNLGFDFPNLPYLIDGDFKMTETLPILNYIAGKYKPELLGENLQDKATISMLMNVIHIAKDYFTGPCYSNGNRDEILAAGNPRLEPLEKYLGDKDFFMGSSVTLPDLHITELLHLVQAIDSETKEFATKFPKLKALQERVDALPEIKSFLESERCLDIPFNNTRAKLNP